jgi:hypothetical protein
MKGGRGVGGRGRGDERLYGYYPVMYDRRIVRFHLEK